MLFTLITCFNFRLFPIYSSLVGPTAVVFGPPKVDICELVEPDPYRPLSDQQLQSTEGYEHKFTLNIYLRKENKTS